MVNKLRPLIAILCLAFIAAFPSSGRYSGLVYSGPANVMPGAAAWWGLRAYNAAFTHHAAITVRRASDNATQDILIKASGDLDIASANTFAGTDATCIGTAAASTSLSLTGCSATPKVGDTLTSSAGTGSFTQPVYIVSCGSFTGGAGTCTLNSAQTVTGVTVTAQVALFVTELFDQTGNGHHMTQATNASQAQLLPSCVNGLPCLFFNGGQIYTDVTGSCPTHYYPMYIEFLGEHTGDFTDPVTVYSGCGIGNFSIVEYDPTVGFGASGANNSAAGMFRNPNKLGAAATNGSPHIITWLFRAYESTFCGLSSCLGSATSINDGGSPVVADTGYNIQIGSPDDKPASIGWSVNTFQNFGLVGYLSELGVWPRAPSSVEANNICANSNTYWLAGIAPCTFNSGPTYAKVTGPCDIVACTEAWSMTRAMLNSYTGPLFRLENHTTGAFADINQDPTTRKADMTTWSAFCGGSQSNCRVMQVYSQIHTSFNDLYPVNSVASCPNFNTYDSCNAPFTIEAATGLPILNTVSAAGQYTGINPEYVVQGWTDDTPITGLPTVPGTQTGGVAENVLFPTSTELSGNCCGQFGTDHKSNAGTVCGTDFAPDVGFAAGNYDIGLDAEQGSCVGGSNIGSGGAIGPSVISAFIAADHDQASTAINISYNSHFGYYNIPSPSPVISLTGAYMHMGGGGDLSQPAPIKFREGFIYPSTMNSTVYANVLANETAFYSGLSFP